MGGADTQHCQEEPVNAGVDLLHPGINAGVNLLHPGIKPVAQFTEIRPQFLDSCRKFYQASFQNSQSVVIGRCCHVSCDVRAAATEATSWQL